MRFGHLALLLLPASVPLSVDQVRVATSGTHTLVIAPDGTVMCQGRNHLKQCGVPGDAAALSGHRGLALKADGTLFQWGPTGSQDAAVQRLPAALAAFTLDAPRR